MAFIRNVDKLIEGLENKFFTEARAKAALAPELASEAASRAAGDAAEAAAREAADNALDARLDVIEGSGEGSVSKAKQDAKDYADQKVAALVNSAPAVLDTLKELSDALGSDPNFATTVSNQIGVVDAKVNQEILDRQSAVSAEQSARESADQALDGRLDLLEADSVTKAYVDGEVSDLQGQITQEISDRQSAVSSEQSARELADSNLSGRISVLEQDPTTKAYVDGEVSDLQGQINQEISDRQSAVSSEQSRAQSAEQALDGRIDILEQDPTTKAYVDQEVSAEESRAMLAEQGLQSDIDAEEVRAMAAESALDGRIDVLEQDPTTKAYVDSKVVMLQGEVDSEESRAMSAEQALDGRLDVLEQDPVTKSYVDGEMSSEEQRAMSAEAALDGRLDVLEQDPTTKAYVDGIQSALDSRLDVLESDPVTKSYVDGEVSDLQGQVNTEKGRIDAILSAADADKDSFAEIVSLINSVDTSNDSAFASYVLSNDAALAQEVSDREDDVDAEESRAMAAESALDGRLDVLESDPTTKTYVDGQISSEQSARQNADNALDARLDVLEADPTTKSYVDSQISSEASARSSEDLTMFKKDGSRNMTGNILFQTNGVNNIGSAPTGVGILKNDYTNRPQNIIATGRVIGSRFSSQVFSNTGFPQIDLARARGTESNPSQTLVADTLGNIVFWSMPESGVQKANANLSTTYFVNPTSNSSNSAYFSFNVTPLNFSSSSLRAVHQILPYGSYFWAENSSSSPSVNFPMTLAIEPDSIATGSIPPGAGNQGGGITCFSQLKVNAGLKVGYSAKSENYTLVSSDYIIAVSDLSSSKVMTLPSAVTMGAGKTYVIKDQSGAASHSNYIQIAPQAGQQIDGQNDYKVVMPYESVMLVSNGSHWFII